MTALWTSTTRHDPSSAAASVRELWAELSATMRRMRTVAGVSLRRVEAESGVGRGTLSQFETAKTRPNRSIVEWYDTALGGDGLLLSIFAEARGAHGPAAAGRELSYAAGDELTIVGCAVPFGVVVGCGTTVEAGWTLRNTGTVAWRDRRLERAGARSGIRLISSAASVSVPDCEPGQSVECAAELGIPATSATYVAYWQMTDGQGRAVIAFDPVLCVQVVARDLA